MSTDVVVVVVGIQLDFAPQVNAAEVERAARGQEHSAAMARFIEADAEMRFLERDLKGCIKKSRPFFELKARSNAALEVSR